MTFSLPSTFPTPGKDQGVLDAWKVLSGRWSAKAPAKVTDLVLAPRLPRADRVEPAGTLSGFIVSGEHQGALHFTSPPSAGGVCQGLFIGATEARHATPVEVDVKGPELTLALGAGAGRRVFHLQRSASVSHDALSRICVIGHQALRFGPTGNRLRDFENAFYFGVSGIEFDVTIPFRNVPTFSGKVERELLDDQLLVVHPVADNNMIELSLVADPLPASLLFPQLGSFGVPFFYVDAKVAGPELDRVRAGVLRRIVTLMGMALRKSPHLLMSVSACNRAAASFLGGTKAPPPKFAAGASWILEWASNDKPRDTVKNAKRKPALLGLDLLGVRDTIVSPIGPFVTDLSAAAEAAIKNMPQPLIFFTANTTAELESVLRVHGDPKRFGRKAHAGKLGIITDRPHALAHWLATRD
jgi:hypothetical protein